MSRLVDADKKTVSRYIDLLEKSFIIYRLNSLSRNLRKEIGKSRKIYFYDLGVRNSLINNFNPLEIRNDREALWENYVITERMKYLNNTSRSVNNYYWITYDKQEIDYVEEAGGQYEIFEIKWKKQIVACL